MTKVLILFGVLPLLGLAACGRRESGRKQQLEFESFTVEEGVYRPKPGWRFTRGQRGTLVVAKDNAPGVIITPCECALETGGSCNQAERRDPKTDEIKEVWCIDNKCGHCLGGVADPDDPSAFARFNVVCVEGRKMSQE